ncbi:MAG: guanylate kinase [bacterium]|jgi:guanylate kinase
MKTGILLIVSGPSGVGKGTVCSALRGFLPALHYSVSATTRPPRPGERDGIDYFFLGKAEFEQRIQQDGFLEWALVYGNYYGTPRDFVEETLAQGEDVLLEVDIQGALQVKKKFPAGVFVFLLPPSLAEQRRRIENRGTENKHSMLTRLKAVQRELEFAKQYDYIIVNEQIATSVDKLVAIIKAEKCRVIRNQMFLHDLIANCKEGKE